MELQVSTVTVLNLETSRNFYKNILGFKVLHVYEPTDWVSYKFEKDSFFAIQEQSHFIRDESEDEIDFLCADIERYWNQIKDKVVISESLKITPWGSYKFVIKDPDGLKIGFVEKKKRAKIDMLGLFVSDHTIMVPFYRDVLGFEIEWNGQGPYAEFVHEGIRFSMYARSELPKLFGQNPEYVSRLNGTFEIAINVGDPQNVDIRFQAIVSGGGKVVYPPRDEPWKMRSAMITDPDGNIIEIASDFWK